MHYADIQDPLDFPFLVVGNKVDLGDTARSISPQEIEQWCSYHGNPPYYETSAKTDINISKVFSEAVQQWIRRENDLDRKTNAANTLYLADRQDSSKSRRSCC